VVRVDGRNGVIGGTSAVAPLWAGLAALLNEKLGRPVGYLNPVLYRLAVDSFRDIQKGDNDISGGGKLYQAGPGWDPCTGLGSPNGAALLEALQAESPVA
jgi:kumamolisin